MSADTCFVYILRSVNKPERYYVGLTADPSQRLRLHNAAACRSTAANRPWRMVAIVEFADASRAAAFERYLKSGSGRAFANRHLR